MYAAIEMMASVLQVNGMPLGGSIYGSYRLSDNNLAALSPQNMA